MKRRSNSAAVFVRIRLRILHPVSNRIGLRSNIHTRSVQFIFSLALCYLNISLLPAEEGKRKL